jgi:hypothetical protein
MINPISLLLIGPFFEMGNSEMKVHTVGKDHTKQKIVACELPVILYQMNEKAVTPNTKNIALNPWSEIFFGIVSSP